jgi:hypothetical protein
MRMARRSITALITVAVLLLIMTTGTLATSPIGDEWLPDVRLSSELRGPVAVRGRTLNDEGRATATRLILVAWPTPEVMQSASDGDSMKLVPVGKALSTASGSFEVRIDPVLPIQRFMAEDGSVNFDLLVQGADGSTVFSFPLRFDAGRRSWSTIDTSAVDRPPDVTISVVDGPARPAATDVPRAVVDGCSTTVIKTWNGIDHTIGEIYTGPDARGDFEYKQTASSTVGVGYSVSGDYGSWEQSGTTSVSASWTENYPLQLENRLRYFRTNFGWRRYLVQCSNPGGYISWNELRPYQFQGGQVLLNAASAPTATNCVSYVAGGSTTKDRGTAVTWTNGVHLGSVVGIDLTSRTGFDASTKLTFHWQRAGRLCGTNTFPPDAARVVAKG